MITQKIVQDLKANMFSLIQNPSQNAELVTGLRALIDDMDDELKLAREVEQQKRKLIHSLGQFLDQLGYFEKSKNKAGLLADEAWKKKVITRLDNVEAHLDLIAKICQKYDKGAT